MQALRFMGARACAWAWVAIVITEELRARWRKHIENRCRVNESGCWIWQRARGSHGYGSTRIPGNGTAPPITASRLSFLAFNGELADNEEPRHTCNNKLCCRPDHLIPGSHHANCMDAAVAGVLAKKLTPDLVRQIRREAALKKSLRKIAAAFGVTPRTISQILRGATWVHVA